MAERSTWVVGAIGVEIDDDVVDSITEYYNDNFECEGCEVEAEVCDWTD